MTRTLPYAPRRNPHELWYSKPTLLSTLSQPTTRDSAYMVDSDAVQITNYLVFLAG